MVHLSINYLPYTLVMLTNTPGNNFIIYLCVDWGRGREEGGHTQPYQGVFLALCSSGI